LGGNDDISNLARLTPEEHYVAHQLLVKIYPHNQKLLYAVRMMTIGRYRNNKLYGWIRRRLSTTMMSEEHRDRISRSNAGKRKTEEHKKKISEAKKGSCLSEEHKKKISESLAGHVYGPCSEERKKKISETLTGQIRGPLTDNARKKISEANKGNNKYELVCPVCNKIGHGPLMYRYHFGRCKNK